VVEIGRAGYDQLVVPDEVYESESHVDDAIAWLHAKHRPPGWIYAGHAPADVDRFKRAGLRVEQAKKSIDPVFKKSGGGSIRTMAVPASWCVRTVST
jgi:hypothetical protein